MEHRVLKTGITGRVFCLVAISWFFSVEAAADWLLLLHTDVIVNLEGNGEVKTEIEVKFRDNMKECYDFEIMPWAAYRFSEWFKLGAGFRELYSKNAAGDQWQMELRPLMDFMVTMKPWALTVEERLRVEYRTFENMEAYFRFRNRLRVRSPWKWTKVELAPWVAWEAYYENNPDLDPRDRLNRHRFFIGIGAKPSKNFSAGCYYYREAVKKNVEWKPNNEIGLEAGLRY